MKKNTAMEAALPAHSAPHPPAAPAAPAAAPDQVTAAPGEPLGVFLFAVSAGGRAHHREDYAAVR
ncbi:hypothetical protein OHA37_27395 [Streptomyces sp. NBC_00335]|uniref:hypothetical protein n=1 Tax=unclassified Streptomyces TaxID=2593676 RepID=UPI00225BF5ED|nr:MULTISPECIES: hypothetical protein [unclassified Streptomyces]MCX5407575.1 hypothetical protein [Streptomyces sp. NBC_00086]